MTKRYHYEKTEAGWETILQVKKSNDKIEVLFLEKSIWNDYFIGYFDDSADACDINDRKSVLDCFVANENNGWSEGGFGTITEANYVASDLFCADGFQPFAEFDL